MTTRTKSQRSAEEQQRIDAIAERIRAARGERTQQRLAVDAGIDASSLSRYERGRSEPSIRALEAIGGVLGVRAEWLRTGRGRRRVPSADDLAPTG